MIGRGAYFGLTTIATGALAAASVMSFAPRVLYNPSISAPIGFYEVRVEYPIRKDALVAAHAPLWARALGAARGYLPEELPLLKTVWAEPGDRVCAERDRIAADGRPDISLLKMDSMGREMPRWRGCRILKSGEYFLISTDVQTSFDSRYFGPVSEEGILGVARPLWVWASE